MCCSTFWAPLVQSNLPHSKTEKECKGSINMSFFFTITFLHTLLHCNKLSLQSASKHHITPQDTSENIRGNNQLRFYLATTPPEVLINHTWITLHVLHQRLYSQELLLIETLNDICIVDVEHLRHNNILFGYQ
jgi:hypothetical protein